MKIKRIILQAFFVLFSGGLAIAQDMVITGKVVDQAGIPLVGASVIIEGTSSGVATDFDGMYTIVIDSKDLASSGGKYASLVASYVGFVTKRAEIGNRTVINFELMEDTQLLEDVVVTAQGISKQKRSLGYAVTKLNSNEINQRPEADISRALLGKIAGVQINASSGQTGENVDITIRSSLSINQSNSPLIVVNNVPFSGNLQDIDPNDIENISILKGLNASILYGSQGRNGVILVQTKSGTGKFEERKPNVDISQTTYFNQVANLPEYQNKYGSGSDFGFAGTIGNWGPAFNNLDLVPHPYANQGTVFPEFANLEIPYRAVPNNVKDIFETGVGNVASINISSGQEKTSLNLSAGYTDEEGVIGENGLKRFNLGLGGSIKLSDKFSVSTSLTYSNRKINTLQTEEIFDRLLFIPRNIDLLNLPFQNPQTGTSVYYRSEQNPLWVINNTGETDQIIRTFTTVNANYNFTDKLSLNYRTGIDTELFDGEEYSNKGGFGENEQGFLELGNRKDVIVDQSLILSLKEVSFSERIGFDAQVGLNSRFLKGKFNSSNSSQQIVFGFISPQNFSVANANSGKYTENLAGLFGQLEFSYDRFLYLTLSGRNDWGSTVEQQNRSLFYPGASLSFIPTSAFSIDSKAINYLKIRGAYATSSGFPDRFLTRAILETNPRRFIDADGNVVISNGLSSEFANPDLKPELHKEIELGLEARLFNNRVTLESSIFKRISEDQILEADRPPSTGFNETTFNAGRIDTEGIEVDMGIDLAKGEKLKWNLRNIFTAYETTVVDLPQDRISLGNSRFAIEGQPFGVVRGSYVPRDLQGNFLINPDDGFLLDSDDIGLEDIIIGDPSPDWSLTAINTIGYKGFSLQAQIEYVHGGDILADQVADLLVRGVTRDTENREGSFVMPGVLGDPSTGKPFLDTNGQTIPNTIQTNANRAVFSSYYSTDGNRIFDASTLRLREISLSYSLDRKVMDSLPFKGITLSLMGRNLWYKAFNFPKYSNYDPENDGGRGDRNLPTTKRFALTVSASF